jgi:arsenate reductase-like glutaredoxin family protein
MPSYELDLYKFGGYNTQVLGISVDHVPCLKAWAESLGGISYPLLSDFWPHGAVAEKYGAFRSDGKSERALFIIDKQGIVQYVDIHDIDDQPDNKEVFKVLRQLEPHAVIPEREEEPEPESAAAVGAPRSVTLYCRPGCIDCRLARRFLDRNGVTYTEVNVRAMPEAEARVREWTGGDLVSPVFDIDGTIVIDFKRAELSKALGLD